MIMLLLIFLFTSIELGAKPGCMDNSKHADLCDGWDYKDYYYVYCNCPCDRYPHTFDRDRCTQCLHYHVPGDDTDEECD